MSTTHAIAARPYSWDGCGVAVSALCIVHCVALPYLAALLPALVIAEAGTHAALALAIFAIGALAVARGFRRHRRIRVPLGAAAGMALLAAPLLLPEGTVGEFGEAVLTVTGGALMVISHLGNAWFCRHCPRCADDACALQPGQAKAKA